MRKNPYKDGQTHSSVVVFLDILGFSAAIADAHKQSSENQLLSKLQQALKEAKPYLDDRLSAEELCPDDPSFKVGADSLQPRPRWLDEVYVKKGSDLVRRDSGATVSTWKNVFRHVTKKPPG